MSLALLNQIVQAEKEADEIVREARQKARSLIRSAEEAAPCDIREAEEAHRAEAERALLETRLSVEDEIKTLEVRYNAEHASLRERSMENVGRAAQWIYERILSDVGR